MAQNLSIHWTRPMLDRFNDKLDPYGVTHMANLPWDLDILCDFSDIIEFDSLHLNSNCWNRTFPEYNERKNMLELLDALREEVMN